MQGIGVQGTGLVDARSRMLELQGSFELVRLCSYINAPRASLQLGAKISAHAKKINILVR